MNEQDALIRRLADANPVPQHRVEGAGATPFADELLIRIAADRRSPIPALPRRQVPRSVVAAACAVLVVLVVAGALVLRGGGGSPATASELLLRAAVSAELRVSAPAQGRYLYSKMASETRTVGGDGGPIWSAVVPATEETWVAADGSGRIRTVTGPHRFFGPRDEARWEASGSPPFLSGVSDHTFRSGRLPYEDVGSLPTDPAALEARLREEVSSEDPPGDVSVFVRVAELLARGDASPELRGALYRVASGLPGVELLGSRSDPIGRPGVAVAMTHRDTGILIQVVMIFDEETSKLLAQEEILLERASAVDAEPGTRLQYTAYLESGRTDSIEEVPVPQS